MYNIIIVVKLHRSWLKNNIMLPNETIKKKFFHEEKTDSNIVVVCVISCPRVIKRAIHITYYVIL